QDVPYEDEIVRSLVVWFPRLGIAALILLIASIAANLYLVLKPRVPPYVVAINNGRIVGYAQPFAGDDDLAPMVIEDRLKTFIYDARVVTANTELEQRNIHVVYAMARGQ